MDSKYVEDFIPLSDEYNFNLSSKECEVINKAYREDCGLLLIIYEIEMNGQVHKGYALDEWETFKYSYENAMLVIEESFIKIPSIFLDNIK